ncbi:hypothetical protein LC085_16870 [Bacillus tianshenii]|uniref:hypothetical protein n=1 Tax=Sutcliffiella tianshenii TaxID=1463404 RepID=UPI001CD70210|nr:hypothetical protein [Bacillus tianshenii]MCA1321580.1 hypothetical protein [Bacillus tianshenii]
MKLSIFKDIIGMTVAEIKECKRRSKRSDSKADKAKYLTLVYMNVLFLIVYLIPVIYSLVMIGGAFIYGPIVLLGLILTIPFILFVLFIKVKAYPSMKENYLNGATINR